MKETSSNISETAEKRKKHEKKKIAHTHLVQLKTGNEVEYMEIFYMCFLVLLCIRLFFPTSSL